jgi:hypothetical protein
VPFIISIGTGRDEWQALPDNESDIVGTLGRCAAGAIGIRAEVGPGAIKPVGKDDAEVFALRDFRP